MSKEYINLEGNRGSGRTTRMLFAAVQQAVLTGERVYIVVHNQDMLNHCGNLLNTLFKYTAIERITIIEASSTGAVVNNNGVVVLGVKPELVFVDHHVYYNLLQGVNPLIEGFHKYDS